MELITLVSIATAAMLAWPTTEMTNQRIILLPSANGSPSAVVVRGADGERLLDKSYASLNVMPNGTTKEVSLAESDVRARYSQLLDAQPHRPQSFQLYFVSGSDSQLTTESAQVLKGLQAYTLKTDWSAAQTGDKEFFGTVSATAFAQATLPKRTELRADLHEELPQPMVMPAPALHAQATSSVMVRKPASALPTPGLAHASVHSRKTGQTKSAAHANIDLAKIYLSMGDPSTAQMLLQQVIEQGNEAEKTTASQLLKNMA